jgi:hypothetical protein
MVARHGGAWRRGQKLWQRCSFRPEVEETRFGKVGRMGRALGRPILEKWKTKIESGGDAKIIWARIDFGPRIEIENVF